MIFARSLPEILLDLVRLVASTVSISAEIVTGDLSEFVRVNTFTIVVVVFVVTSSTGIVSTVSTGIVSVEIVTGASTVS